MTGITLGSRYYMRSMFSGCNYAVMTAGTYSGHFVVINKYDRRPGRWAGCMTGITYIACINMIDTLATGYYAVMTTGTSTNDMAMINCTWRNWRPGSGARRMTGITGVG